MRDAVEKRENSAEENVSTFANTSRRKSRLAAVAVREERYAEPIAEIVASTDIASIQRPSCMI